MVIYHSHSSGFMAISLKVMVIGSNQIIYLLSVHESLLISFRVLDFFNNSS